MTDERVTPTLTPAEVSFELSSRNTGLALQRTRMAADRTLMAVIRTSLSLISFGFTISQIFEKLKESGVLKSDVPEVPKFGVSLVLLGIMMLILGIGYHGQFMYALRVGRKRLMREGLIHGESPFPASLTLITALILLAIGIAAMTSMIFHSGPFE